MKIISTNIWIIIVSVCVFAVLVYATLGKGNDSKSANLTATSVPEKDLDVNIAMSHGPVKDGLAAFLICEQNRFKLDESVPLLYGIVYSRSGRPRIIRIVPPHGAVDPGNRSWLSVTGPDGNDVPYIGIYVTSPRPDSGDVLQLGSGSFHGYLDSNIRYKFKLRTSGTYTIKWHCEMIPVDGVSCWAGELVSNEIQIEIVE